LTLRNYILTTPDKFDVITPTQFIHGLKEHRPFIQGSFMSW